MSHEKSSENFVLVVAAAAGIMLTALVANEISQMPSGRRHIWGGTASVSSAEGIVPAGNTTHSDEYIIIPRSYGIPGVYTGFGTIIGF